MEDLFLEGNNKREAKEEEDNGEDEEELGRYEGQCIEVGR